MQHIKSLSRPPRPASTDIDLNGSFDSKIEGKEAAVNAKATALS